MLAAVFAEYRQLPGQVWLLCLGSLVNRAGSFLIPFLSLYLTREIGLSERFAASALGAFGLGFMSASLIGGWAADRFGRRSVQIASMTSAAAMLVLFPLLRSPLGLLVGIFCFALISEMYRPAASAMLADLVEPERRTQAYALLYLAVNLGFTLATVVGGWVAVRSFRWLFYGDAITCSLFAVIIVLFLKETRPSTEGADGEEGRPLAPSGSSYGTILRDGPFLRFCLATTALGLVFSQALSTFPLYLDSLGLDAEVYGRIMAVNGILIVLLQIPTTSFLARFPRGPVMVIGASFYVVGFGLKAGINTAPLFVVAVFIWTLGEIILAPLQPAVVVDMAPTPLRARYFGAYNLTFAVALILGAPLGGLVLQRWGGSTLFAASGVVGVVAVALYLSILPHLGAPSRRGESRPGGESTNE